MGDNNYSLWFDMSIVLVFYAVDSVIKSDLVLAFGRYVDCFSILRCWQCY